MVHIKRPRFWSLHVILWIVMGLKPYSVFSACRARGRVCLEHLVFTKLYELLLLSSSWKPREYSSRSKRHTIHKNFFRNKAVSGWCNLVLPRPTREHSRFQIHICNSDHQYQSQNAFTSVPGTRRLRGTFSIILLKDFELFVSFLQKLVSFLKNYL